MESENKFDFEEDRESECDNQTMWHQKHPVYLTAYFWLPIVHELL